MDDYREITESLKPKRDIKASEELRGKVRAALERECRQRTAKKWMIGGISLSAAAAIILMVFMPSAMSAGEFLALAIDALVNADCFRMTVKIRTRPVENFRYIDMNEDFVEHRVEVVNSDSLSRWRIDKGERIAMGNGCEIYTWIPSLNLGWHINESDNENVLGYMSALLNPEELLEAELDNCLNNSKAEYKVSRTDSVIILTVHAYPQGNFDNPYLLNTSIMESESIREYIVDAESKQLKSVTVSIVSGMREIIVLKVLDIIYGLHPDEIDLLPDSIRFVEFDKQPDGLKGLSAEEAASTFLNAFADWNEDIIDEMMAREIEQALYKEHYQGARLDSIGRAFTSGSGNSVFVPYTLQLRDGTTQRHNIALQKNDSGGWVVSGGI